MPDPANMSTCKPEFDEIRATAQKSLYDWEHYDYEAECRESADRQRASYLAHSGDADCEDFFPTIPLKSAGPLMVAYHPSVMLALVDERDALVAERDLLREAATRFRRAATLIERTEKTILQWPSAEVDAFIAAFPISEDEIHPQC